MKKKRPHWLKREKLKNPDFNQIDTQLSVQKLPPDLLPKVRKFCLTNDIKIRRFVEDCLRLGLEQRLGAKKKSRLE